MKKTIEWLKEKWDNLNKQGKIFACAIVLIGAWALFQWMVK